MFLTAIVKEIDNVRLIANTLMRVVLGNLIGNCYKFQPINNH